MTTTLFIFLYLSGAIVFVAVAAGFIMLLGSDEQAERTYGFLMTLAGACIAITLITAVNNLEVAYRPTTAIAPPSDNTCTPLEEP